MEYSGFCINGYCDGAWVQCREPVYKHVQSKICVAELFRKGIPDESNEDAEITTYVYEALPGGGIWRLREESLETAMRKLLISYQPVRVQ